MSQETTLKIGSIGWIDLTVPDADKVRDFYKEVIGWTATEVPMGGYSDYCMNEPDSGKTVAGVCHHQGTNADIPAARWIVYITVADLDKSLAVCKSQGGEVVAGPKSMGQARYAMIKDPAGAICALYQE